MTPSPYRLGTHEEPLIDETLIGERMGVEFKLHGPVKREIVFPFDRPWEKRSPGYATFLRDEEGKIRMYYRAASMGGDLSDQQTAALAVSDDGIHFERPVLGLVEEEGSKENNLIWRGVEGHNLTPFLDTNPAAPSESRYKATGGPMWKLYALHSADGIHWSKMRDEPLDHEGVFDSQNTVFWDDELGCYRSFSRYFDGGWPKGIRAIQSATSEDFLHWTQPKPHRYNEGLPLEHFYTNATIRYPGHDNLLLSFPKRFIPERKVVEEVVVPKGVSDAVFMTSRDGEHWERRFPEAWVRPGLDRLNWVHRSNMISLGMLQLTPEEWSLYIEEHNGSPDKRIRRMTIRAHGFVSLHAGYSPGEFVTKPLIFEGRALHLNFSTSAPGHVQVEIQNPDGTPVPGFAFSDMEPLYGDSIDHVVEWKDRADLSPLVGRPVRLKFSLREADIYSLKIG